MLNIYEWKCFWDLRCKYENKDHIFALGDLKILPLVLMEFPSDVVLEQSLLQFEQPSSDLYTTGIAISCADDCCCWRIKAHLSILILLKQ